MIPGNPLRWFAPMRFSRLEVSLYHERFLGIKRIPVFFVVFFIWATGGSYASDFNHLKGDGFEVIYSPPLERVANETAQMTPEIENDLQKTFNWPFNFDPTVILTNDGNHFQQITQSPLVVGFAVPEKNLVVINCSGIKDPVNFRDILKHEFCHLLIHNHITHVRIPRWFDEGIAQWSSNGVMDILNDPKDAFLPKAAFSDRLIPLGALGKGFPKDPKALRLAYEESASFIDFFISGYGKPALLETLQLMKDGSSLRKSVLAVSGTPLYEIEEDWRRSLKENIAWFAHLSFYLYDILFVFGGLVVVYGFMKVLRKKRAYMEEG